jgi:hypothetical protein
MLCKRFAVLLGAAALMAPASAWASGDYDCFVTWTLKPAGLTDCNNFPFLSPTNDSRVNLQLLLLDAGKVKLNAPAPGKQARYPWLPAGSMPFALEDLTALIQPPPTPAPGESPVERVEGEASRCDSNATGAQEFAEALSASGAPPAERVALIKARGALMPTCMDDPKPAPPSPPVQASSAVGKQFATYLAGASAFYDGRYDAAAQSFGSLQASSQPWLKETSRYMLGRVALNRAQAGTFDEFGRLEAGKIDGKSAAAARTAFEAYLRDYPAGAYADSARGLLRRADWLGGRRADLTRDLAQAFDAADPKALGWAEINLVEEADSKLLSDPGTDAAAIRDPMLLAVFDLMHMRSGEVKTDPKFLTQAQLESQRPLFAGREGLYDYLRAAFAFYQYKDPKAALAVLPKTPPSGAMTYLEFSRQLLRAMALEETGDHTAARALWLALMPVARPPLQHATLELGLAMNYERAGQVGQAFAAGSPISDPDLRETLLTYAADPDLLRRQAQAAKAPDHERRVALYALLYKELTRKRYDAFAKDLALLPAAEPARDGQTVADPNLAAFRWDGHSDDGYLCPSVKEVALSLARDPARPGDLICLDETVRVGGMDDSPLDRPPSADVLGGAPSQFPGGPYSRLESYKALIADPKTPEAVKTYALYRAVECYAPSGNNSCGGKEVAVAQRKAWFQTLKTTYAKSEWAKLLKYYW